MNQRSFRVVMLIAIVLCLVPLTYYILWIYIAGAYKNFSDAVVEYHLFLPAFLREGMRAGLFFLGLTAVAIALCIITIVSEGPKTRFIKVASSVTLIISSLLFGLNLFGLM